MTSLRSFPTIKQRREYIEKQSGISLPSLSVYPGGLEIAETKNCEQMIGAVQIPVGIAGPLKVNNLSSSYETFLPLATTEAALVASINRGCKVITLAGGASVWVEESGMTRGPVFQTQGLSQSMHLKKWMYSQETAFHKISSSVSAHITFLGVYVRVAGRSVFARFSFSCDEAMGMNMVTSATARIASYIEEQTGATCLSLAGNFDIDKKPATMNAFMGRGKQTWAEIVLSEDIVRDHLKTSVSRLQLVIEKKCLLGSALSGSLGYNAHIANTVAALFLATGQDPAHIVEGSLGITTTDTDTHGISISVHLPSLVIGVIGGGTGLPAQEESLKLLGIDPEKKEQGVIRFAEIMTAAALAGEISLLASLAEGSLARSHERLAGKRHV